MNDKIRELNGEIEEMETDYWNSKFDYEQQRANLLLGTDFGAVIGKAKPTVAEKDAYINIKNSRKTEIEESDDTLDIFKGNRTDTVR